MKPETWTLYDKAKRTDLGSRQYPSLPLAMRKRAHLVEAAAKVSQECAEDVERRCDVRKVG